MKIRQEQMETMSQAKVEAFVRRMVTHLHDDFPKHCKMHGLKTKDLDPLVRRGITEAKRYNVDDEDNLERYLEFMVVLGPHFDRDPKHAWAGEILRRDDLEAGEKIDEISWNVQMNWEEPPE